MAKINSKMSFEDAMKELDDSVARLESSNLSLDDSIAEFEKAIKLVRLCEERLSAAKQKVRILTEGTDGSVTDEPFISQNDDAS